MRSGAVAQDEVAFVEYSLVAVVRESAGAACLKNQRIGSVRSAADMPQRPIDGAASACHAHHADGPQFAEPDFGVECFSVYWEQIRVIDTRGVELVPGG